MHAMQKGSETMPVAWQHHSTDLTENLISDM